MRRLHHPDLPIDGGEVTLGDDASRHAAVLRLAVGDQIALFDGAGHEARARIVAVGDHVRCALDPRERVTSSGPRVVLCQCVPKGAKLDAIVRGATEVGVSAIHLALAERCVGRVADKRIERLETIAREASRQSGRADVPSVLPAAPLLEVAARAPESALRIACVPGGGSIPTGAPEAWIVVGPEGGLSPGEMGSLDALGYVRVDLGPTILRTETAGVVAPALVRAALARGTGLWTR